MKGVIPILSLSKGRDPYGRADAMGKISGGNRALSPALRDRDFRKNPFDKLRVRGFGMTH